MRYLTLLTILIAILLTGCGDITSPDNNVKAKVNITVISSIPGQSWVHVNENIEGDKLEKGSELYIFGAELRPNSVYNVELELLNNWELRSIKYVD